MRPKSIVVLISVLLSLSTLYSLLSTPVYGALSCTACHGYPPSYTSTAAKGNSHDKHPSTCETCHVDVTTAAYTISYATNHVNGIYNLNSSLGYDSATSSCATPGCHTKTYWGGPSLKCGDCHLVDATDVDDYVYNGGSGTKAKISSSTTTGWYGSGHGRKTASGNYSDSGRPAANLINAAATDGTGCAYCHDYTTSHTDSRSGFFRLYVSSNNTICLICHQGPTHAGFNPPDTTAEGTLNLKTAVSTVAAAHVTASHSTESGYTDGGYFCWDCHDPHGDSGKKATLPLAYMIQAQPSELTEGTTAAATAYGVPRSTTITSMTISSFTKTGGKDINNIDVGDYAFAPSSGVCQVCHDGNGGTQVGHFDQKTYDGHNMSETGRCTKSGCHQHDEKFEAEGTCVGCHGSVQSGGTYVRRAVVSEFSQTSGHKRNGGTVDNLDCCVCHMEGSISDASMNTTYHGYSGGTKSIDLRQPDYNTVISSAPARFIRKTGSSNVEVFVSSVQNQLCLQCHDSNGASNSGSYISGEQSTSPFKGGGGAIDVNSQFATTNQSYHPVRGAQNNSYCNATTLNPPWNSATHKRISCFDCHVSSDATNGSTAHGGAAKPYVNLYADYTPTTMTVGDAATPLCLICHNSTIYTAAITAGSAWVDTSVDTKDHGDYHYSVTLGPCGACHGSGWDIYTDRRVRAQDAHGFNTLVGGGNWTSGNYAFIRNTANFPNSGNWAPGSCAGVAVSAACDDRGHAGGGYTYTPGGSYP